MTPAELLARAIEQHQAGRLEEAVASYSAALEIEPELVDALSNRGAALQVLGRFADAEASLRAALAVRPDFADAVNNLGIVQLGTARPEDAAASFRRAIALRPAFALAHFNLGAALSALGELDSAAESYRQALAFDPDYSDAANNLGNVLRDLGRFDEAAANYRRALRLRPGFALAHFNLGSLAYEIDEFEVAATYLGRAVELAPGLSEAHTNLGRTLRAQGALDAAVDSFQRAIASAPDDPNSYCGLGDALRELGCADVAVRVLDQALTHVPTSLRSHKNLLSCILFDSGLDPAGLWTAHARFEAALAMPLYGALPVPLNERMADRRLRVGYLSSDLREHSVARNLLPLLRRHDRANFEVYLYADVTRTDRVTEAFRAHADAWRQTNGLSDRAVAEQIRADGIDILVCLAGRFDQNRPLVAAYRPAPVQISFLDAATSGLRTMDYLIADRTMVPRDTPEKFTERVLCVPRFYLAEIPEGLPEVKPRAEGPVVFGSLNNPAKVNDRVLDLWGRLLAQVPGSRLLLRYRNWYEAASIRARVRSALARHGVDEGRVDYPAGAATFVGHMAQYDGIDVALDTFPFSGSTTTFDALVMGVPVVTLPGWSMMSRWTAAMLRGVGLDELIAANEDDYIRIAKDLAADADRRAELWATLRARVAASPLCDAPGRARQFERLYRAVWRKWCAEAASVSAATEPGTDALFAAALDAHRAGNLQQADAGYIAVLARMPNHVEALSNRGMALHGLGRAAEAEESLRRALDVRPGFADAVNNLGNVLLASGRIVEAVATFEQMPDNAPASSNLGFALARLGRFDEAEAACRRALSLRPNFADAMMNLGDVLAACGRSGDAEGFFRQAAEIVPNSAAAHFNLGTALAAQKRHREATVSFRRALQADPAHADAHINLGNAQRELKELEDAATSYRLALAIRPEMVAAHYNLGNVLYDLDRFHEADASLRRAIGFAPGFAEAHYNLGNTLQKRGHLREAVSCYDRALALDPDYANAFNNRGNARRELGQIDDAIADLERAIALEPTYLDAHRNILAALTYHSALDPERFYAAHARFEAALATPLYGTLGEAATERMPERRLRIGYLSSDFRSHSAARNLLPMFRHHDRNRFELYLYADVARPDALTEAFRELADAWRPIAGLTDRAVAEQMRADAVDILVTLVGRFDQNRPLVAAYRPAPVQISSHDVATSGLRVNDYLIADRTMVPRGTPEKFTERVLCVPRFYLAEIPEGLPEVKPRVGNGPVVFGSLNNPAKVTDAVLDLWGRLLAQVPGSRLLLRYRNWYEAPSLRARVNTVLARHGIDEGRIDYPVGAETFVAHMSTYDGIDVALDTFPFSGSTTTFDALVMGVPVVTLPGWSMVSRWSAGMLAGLKLDDLIAGDGDAYLRIARDLAGDPARRAELRRTLRARVAASPLCDSAARARQYERLYRAVWRRWCVGQLVPERSDS